MPNKTRMVGFGRLRDYVYRVRVNKSDEQACVSMIQRGGVLLVESSPKSTLMELELLLITYSIDSCIQSTRFYGTLLSFVEGSSQRHHHPT